MFASLAIATALFAAAPAFAGTTTERGASVTTTEVYDDYCLDTWLPKTKKWMTRCIYADFRVHHVITPSGNAIYHWDGERSIDVYIGGVLQSHQELSGDIHTITVDGEIQVNSRDTCFYVPEEDVYREVEIHIVNGELVIHEVEDVESCD